MHLPQNTNGTLETRLDVDFTRTYDRAYLINKLNHVDFIGGSVRAVFVHETLPFQRELRLKPRPCIDSELVCKHTFETPVDLEAFRLAYLLIEDFSTTLVVYATLRENRGDALVLVLPETCHPLHRLPSRHRINPLLGADLFQKGTRTTGRLVDYADGRLDIAVHVDPPQKGGRVDTQAPVYLVLMEGREPCFSGNCTIEDRRAFGKDTVYRLKTEGYPFHRYQPKKYRSKRVNLCPSPQVVFTHPLTLQPVSCRIRDLSGMGFSFTVESKEADLFPGLILSGLRLELAGEPIATCKAQVVYRMRVLEEKRPSVHRYGLAILDMSMADHTRLQRVVQQAADPNAYVNGRVSPQALWAFFFETGFIYPQKYAALGSLKDKVQKTYEKLYLDQPSFARHFVYQKRGTILGHMAMLRFYDKAWLIHHHAARGTADAGAGLRVLEQIGQFVNESHALESICMEYVFFFYRPENRFPSLLFGKAAEFVDDPKICSLDKFAYGHFDHDADENGLLPASWSLAPAQRQDLEIFHAFYRETSGGRMVAAFDLSGDSRGFENLIEEYRKIGFQRKRTLVSLKHKGRLKCLFEVNLSDIGLNMSDLTHCIRLFVIDRKGLDRATLSVALNRIAEPFGDSGVPLLIYPADAADLAPLTVERHYLLWVFNLRHTDRYFAFMNRIIRFSRPRGNR